MAKTPRLFAFGLACFAAGVLALWVVDTLVSIGLVSSMTSPSDFVGYPWDFFALLLAEIPIAAAISIAAFVGAILLKFLPAHRGIQKECIPLLLGGYCGFIVLGRLYATRAASNSQCMFAGVVGAMLVWIGFRLFLLKRFEGSWSFAEIAQNLIFTSLSFGFIGTAVIRAAQEKTVPIQDAVLGFLFAAIGLALFLRPSLVLRRFIRWFPVLLAVWMVAWFILDSQRYGQNKKRIAQSEPAARIPIILIVLDTVRADHLQQFGYSRNTMPALERWSEKALVAKRAISPAGWTSPAHASMFSGRTVSLHGVHYSANREAFRSQAVKGIEWLPQLLADQGYYCLGISANRFAFPGENIGFHNTLSPTHNRFDLSLGSLADRKSPVFRRMSERLRWRVPYTDAKGIVDIAIRAVPTSKQPLFLFVNFLDAHSPYNPPRSALKELGIRTGNVFPRYSKHRWLTRSWDSFGDDKMQYLNDLYDGELHWVDNHLARLLRWLEDRYSDDAVIIVVSDHGEELGEEGRIGHEYGLSQRLIHVPLFVRSPWLRAGQIDKIVDLRKLYDFIHLCGSGQAPDAGLLTESDEFGIVSERYVSRENVRSLGPEYGRGWVSIIEAGLKGVGPSEYQLEVFKIGNPAFVEEGPVTDSIKIEQLRRRIDSYWETYRDMREDGEAPTDADVERLRALGYIQ